MSRIQLDDTGMSAITKMSEGNPGAMMALVELMKAGPTIDPQSALGGIGPILSLDTHGIYGSSIYVLFSDKCGRDPRKMLVLLRAVQLGLFSETRLQRLAGDQLRQVELGDEEYQALDAAVCERLVEFQRPTAAAE